MTYSFRYDRESYCNGFECDFCPLNGSMMCYLFNDKLFVYNNKEGKKVYMDSYAEEYDFNQIDIPNDRAYTIQNQSDFF